jgi:hypothetical protein
MTTRTLAFAMLIACSKPAATPPPATPTPTPAPAPAAKPSDADIVALEHDPDAPPKRPPADPHQDQLASQADAEGTVLFDAKNYAEASAKFRDAVARAPVAKYAYDLCRSLYQEGKFSAGLTACDAAGRLEPDAALAASIAKQRAQILADAKAQHIQLTTP